MDAAMEGRGDRQRRPAPVQDLEAYRGVLRARGDFTAYLGMLIFLYSRYVLLALVIGYILNGLLSRLLGIFRRRSETSEASVQVNQP